MKLFIFLSQILPRNRAGRRKGEAYNYGGDLDKIGRDSNDSHQGLAVAVSRVDAHVFRAFPQTLQSTGENVLLPISPFEVTDGS